MSYGFILGCPNPPCQTLMTGLLSSTLERSGCTWWRIVFSYDISCLCAIWDLVASTISSLANQWPDMMQPFPARGKPNSISPSCWSTWTDIHTHSTPLSCSIGACRSGHRKSITGTGSYIQTFLRSPWVMHYSGMTSPLWSGVPRKSVLHRGRGVSVRICL